MCIISLYDISDSLVVHLPSTSLTLSFFECSTISFLLFCRVKLNSVNRYIPEFFTSYLQYSLLCLASRIFGTMAVPANQKWEGMFQQCISVFRVKGQDVLNTQKAWENVAVTLSKGKKNIREIHQK